MQYKVSYNGKDMGTASVYRENGSAMLEYLCPFESGKVYKLYAHTQNGSVPLGVMLKNGNNFCYKRQINCVKLGENGKNIGYLYIEKHNLGSKNTHPLPFCADDFAPCKWIDTPDHALQNCIVEGGILCYIFENVTYVAASFSPDKPFPLAPFMSVVTIVSHEGSLLGVMALDRENNPCHLNKQGET